MGRMCKFVTIRTPTRFGNGELRREPLIQSVADLSVTKVKSLTYRRPVERDISKCYDHSRTNITIAQLHAMTLK